MMLLLLLLNGNDVILSESWQRQLKREHFPSSLNFLQTITINLLINEMSSVVTLLFFFATVVLA